MLRFGNLGYFEIGGWKELESLSQHGLSLVGHRSIDVSFCPQLHSLETEEAELQPDKNLEYLVDEKEDNKSMNSTLCVFEDLNIYHCRSLMSLSSKGHKNICNQLQLLRTCDCSKLSCLFSDTKLPTTLKSLQIDRCPELECIAQEFDETACLESILIECSGIKSLPQGLDKLIHLQEIRLRECSNWFLLKNVSCLQLPPTSELSQLMVVEILEPFQSAWSASPPFENYATKIYRLLVEWGLHRLTSLQELTIRGGGCSNVVSFPEEGIGMMLPPSLTSIRLSNFENLEFIFSEGFQGLGTLRNLFIYSCPKLTYLLEKAMLLSLGYLYILFCPLLKEECSSDKGREWSKISHIPRAQIDFKSVIPRESD
ncbi:hypothetical protein V6Z11_D05G366900 [Gossypium hirsutum]